VDQSKKEGYLQVTTTALRPGYLRTNGVPYGADTQLLEYFDSFKEANGDEYLVVTTVVKDAQYLTLPFVTSSHFRKLPDSRGWDPTACRADEPRERVRQTRAAAPLRLIASRGRAAAPRKGSDEGNEYFHCCICL
jgi:hypothetical protein